MNKDLHSTMYLFQLLYFIILLCTSIHLHSTMYLFQPDFFTNFVFSDLFTFHYVSISTSRSERQPWDGLHLHSTMYLFQLPRFGSNSSKNIFTFHYVSISTRCRCYRQCWLPNLHSTMYLFQPWTEYFNIIKYNHLHSTMYLFQQLVLPKETRDRFIYIPLCIYFNYVYY